MTTMTTEEKIQEIFKNIDELRVLLGLIEEDTELRIEFWRDFWSVGLRPSVLTIGKTTSILRRTYQGNSLDEVLTKAIKGSKKELELFKNGKTIGF